MSVLSAQVAVAPVWPAQRPARDSDWQPVACIPEERAMSVLSTQVAVGPVWAGQRPARDSDW